MEEAKALLKEGKAYGIIYIPESFSRDIAKGIQTRVTLYCDMSGMLYYKAMLTANTNASLTMNKQIKIERSGNTTERQDEVSSSPIEYEDISIFNPQNGFAGFLIPAVLMLIIQQTLLLGIGLSAGTARETNRFRDLVPLSRHYHGTLRIVLGKSLTYFMIYVIMSVYMLCLVPKMFSLVQIAQAGTLFAFVLPYILACIFFAMTCSIFIHHREACMMIYVFTSVPLLFISGISWPGSAIPEFWKVVSWIFPSTFGINGFVRINNMGATLPDVTTEYHALWLQAGIYFLTTCIVYRRQITLSRTHVYACLLIAACNSNKKSTDNTTIAADTEVTDMHNAENALDYDGTYTGTFPAADCPGINITLTLNKDKTFTLVSEYIDRKDATFTDKGNYTIEGNLITLQNGTEKNYYKVGENTLTALDRDKQEITGELAEHYILHKQQ